MGLPTCLSHITGAYGDNEHSLTPLISKQILGTPRLSMARLWREQGKRNEAREFLAPVYGWLPKGLTRGI